eukprot:scaffold314429_cov32-Tisochrysis_lutea.AAC.4
MLSKYVSFLPATQAHPNAVNKLRSSSTKGNTKHNPMATRRLQASTIIVYTTYISTMHIAVLHKDKASKILTMQQVH